MKSSNFVCTVGPSNNTVERIQRMIYKGMSIARLNFSHGSQSEHLETILNLRLAAERCQERSKFYWPVAVAVDLRGPEIRTGTVEDSGKQVEVGDLVKFNNNPLFAKKSSSEMIHIDRPIIDVLKKNHEIIIGDGSIQLQVEDIFGDNITCRVLKGGLLISNQFIFIPEIAKRLNLPVVSEKDKLDLKFCVKHDVDFIFASHIECGEWIDEIRGVLKESEGEKIKIYAKIQNRYGVDELEEIVAQSDGIILSPTVDVAASNIPFIQRMLMMACKTKKKPCLIKIEAEMNPSEIYRAFNWFMESGDGTILTRESTEGNKKPLESMTILKNIKTLLSGLSRDQVVSTTKGGVDIILESLASACVTSAFTTNASAIIIVSNSEEIAHLVYHLLPNCEVIIVMENPKSCRQLNILDRVTPLNFDPKMNLSKYDFAIKFSIARGILKRGDTVVLLKPAQSVMEIHYVPYDD